MLPVDCGATSLVALKAQELDPRAVDAVVVTHLQGGHFGGLPFLILDGQFSRRSTPLHVAGPPGSGRQPAVSRGPGPRRRAGPRGRRPAPGQRQAVTLFYYADQPAGQVAATPGAAKASLHKARRRLREYITAHRPDLIPATSRRVPMTAVRIGHADPWPGRTPDGRMEISHVLVILADDAGHRALPVRLRVPYGKLWRLLSRPDDLNEEDHLDDDHAEEATGRLLQAAGVTNAVRSRAFWGTPLSSSTIQVV